MKSRLIKVFASLVLVVLAVFLVVPNFSHFSAAEGDTYQLVTDASTLKVNDKIIIVATGYNYALSTTQNPNNRGQVEITKTDNNNTIAFVNDLQEITLKAGTVNGTFAFQVGEDYLYCASTSKKNYLKTRKTNDDTKGDWTIAINENNGVATIQSKADVKRNTLKYNSDSSCFACYSSGQNDVSIYKLVENTCDHTNTTPIPEVAATCTTSGTSAAVECTDCEHIISGGEITASKGGHAWDENYVCKVCKATGPDAIADVPNYDDGTKVVVLGTVSNIDKEWSGTYNNISVYISDADGKTLYLYRLATKVEVGDIIRVTGTKSTYKDSAQIAEGATAEILKPTVKGMSATLNKGVTINVKYDIPALWLNANPGAKAVFSNGVEVALVAGVNVCSVNLTPAEINDDLTVKIQIGDTVYGEETDVSFTAYSGKINATDAATLGITETKYNALVALIEAALK